MRIGFTPEEWEEMRRADAAIETEFLEHPILEPDEPEMESYSPARHTSEITDLDIVAGLALRHHSTYGKFVAAHSKEELEQLIYQEKKQRYERG